MGWGPGVADWRRRMAGAAGKAMCRERCKAECVNADARRMSHDRLLVRGKTNTTPCSCGSRWPTHAARLRRGGRLPHCRREASIPASLGVRRVAPPRLDDLGDAAQSRRAGSWLAPSGRGPATTHSPCTHRSAARNQRFTPSQITVFLNSSKTHVMLRRALRRSASRSTP